MKKKHRWIEHTHRATKSWDKTHSNHAHISWDLILLPLVPQTCFSSDTPPPMDGSSVDTNCSRGWTTILRRDGVVGNPGLTGRDYDFGFSVPNFYWYGIGPFFSLTKIQEFNLRIEMWDKNNEFYFAEFEGVRIENPSTGYHLLINNYHDGYLGDGGLIRETGTARFTTTNLLNPNISSCASEWDAVYGWWLYTTECNQTLLTADDGPQYLVTEGRDAGTIMVMDKVIMRAVQSNGSEGKCLLLPYC